MIQGGDYSCRKVTPGKVEKFDVNYTVPAEIIYPKYYHKRGQLCAAREGDDENPTKASASTDFYITWGRNFSPRQMEYYVEERGCEILRTAIRAVAAGLHQAWWSASSGQWIYRVRRGAGRYGCGR